MKKLYVGILALCVLTGANRAKATAKKVEYYTGTARDRFCKALTTYYQTFRSATNTPNGAYRAWNKAEKKLRSENRLMFRVYKAICNVIEKEKMNQQRAHGSTSSSEEMTGSISPPSARAMKDIKTLVKTVCPASTVQKMEKPLINTY